MVHCRPAMAKIGVPRLVLRPFTPTGIECNGQAGPRIKSASTYRHSGCQDRDGRATRILVPGRAHDHSDPVSSKSPGRAAVTVTLTPGCQRPVPTVAFTAT